MANREPTLDLSIFLLNDGVTAESALADRETSTKYVVQLNQVESTLYIKANHPHLPKWANAFEGLLELRHFGKGSSVSAVLLVESSGRLFAATFGYGRMMLAQGCWEERFGLRVVLNTIDSKEIRSVDKHSLDALGRHSRVQTSKAANVGDFGIDIEQDLLKAVTGTPKKQDLLGTRLTGADSLRLSPPKSTLKTLPKLLKDLYDASRARDYLNDFPWIDQLREVTSKATGQALDELLVDALDRQAFDTLRLAVPSIVDWSRISRFRFEGIGDAFERVELDLIELNAIVVDGQRSWEDAFRSARVSAVDDDGISVEGWQLKKCISGELELDEKTFVLTGGRWFEVERRFVDSINAAVQKIPAFEALPSYDDKNEAAYCTRVAQESEMWSLMDRDPVTYGGGRSRVEFCDLFRANDQTLLHVKRYGGSSPLSHLFAQGLVSGEAFRGDSAFRELVNKKLPVKHRFADTLVAPTDCRVAFGIVKANSLSLPFFAKVALKQSAQRLRNLTFSVALAHIPVEPKKAKALHDRRRPRV